MPFGPWPGDSGGGGTPFPGFGNGVPGPTALGAVGGSPLARRSDQAPTAYRSDLPLATTWFIDPVNGSDASTNPGTSAATALRTLHGAGGLKQRWWSADISVNTTVTVLGNIPATDVGAWLFTIKPGVLVTFIGSLGATTGFGGAAINNTLYTGTVTGFVGAANAPTADQITMTDAAIPVSFTASGLLAAGVIFRRNSGGAVQHWYALKDNGAKTIRISSPMANVGANSWGTLNIADGYSAYAMFQMPTQYWPAGHEGSVLCDTLYDIGPSLEQSHPAPRRRRVWLGTQQTTRGIGFGGWVNCLWEVGAGGGLAGNESAQVTPQIVGGAARGNGASVISVFRDVIIGACWIGQGVQLAPNDAVLVAIETQWAQHDCTIPCLAPVNGARFNFAPPAPAGAGMSGMGNTGKIFSTAAAQDGSFMYNVLTGATPPFIAGVTTDANPITIAGVNFTVAAIPATTPTRLDGTVQFP